MRGVTPRTVGGLLVLALALALPVLACGNMPQEVDTQATVRAFYATITAQAASGSPFPTRVVSTQAAPQSDNANNQPPTQPPTPTERPTATPPPEGRSGNGTNFSIVRCGNDIAVDADDGDWGFYRGVIISAAEPVWGEGEWQNTADLNAEIRVCWTDSALYYIANVVDDIHVQNEQGITMYQGDEIEVFIDGDLFGDFYDDEMNADDTHYGFSPGNFADIPTDAVRYVPRDTDPPGIAIAARRPIGVGAGYVMEGGIPWALTDSTPQMGKMIGLCLTISDNDHVNTSQQDTVVSHCRNWVYNDPTTWVTAQFGG